MVAIKISCLIKNVKFYTSHIRWSISMPGWEFSLFILLNTFFGTAPRLFRQCIVKADVVKHAIQLVDRLLNIKFKLKILNRNLNLNLRPQQSWGSFWADFTKPGSAILNLEIKGIQLLEMIFTHNSNLLKKKCSCMKSLPRGFYVPRCYD